MKTIVVTFSVRDDLAEEAEEYALDALQSHGGAFLPDHPFFHVRKNLENLRAVVRPTQGGTTKAQPVPIIGQRCIVRRGEGYAPFIGLVVMFNHDFITVRHAMTRAQIDVTRDTVELLPP